VLGLATLNKAKPQIQEQVHGVKIMLIIDAHIMMLKYNSFYSHTQIDLLTFY